MSQRTLSQDPKIELKNLKTGSWILLFVYLTISMIAAWQFVLPYLAERHYREGFNLSAMARYAYAKDELEEAVQDAPWESLYQMEWGKNLELLAGETQNPTEKVQLLLKAESIYSRMIQLDDQNPWYRNRLATVYFSLSEMIPAKRTEYLSLSEQCTKKAAEVDAKNPLFQLNYAYFLHRLARFDEAEAYYRTVIRMDTRICEAHFNLADILKRRGDTAGMIQEYETIYEINPDFNGIRLALGSIYMQNKDYDKAIPLFQEELVQNPSNIQVWDALIGLYQHQNAWTAALPFLEAQNKANPANVKAMGAYAQALLATQQPYKAYTVMEGYLRFDPYNQAVIEQINRLKKGLNIQS
ncbi:MAG: tetratricopeptide repeat protein [Candidatus Margulisiibacteriota bacterium]